MKQRRHYKVDDPHHMSTWSAIRIVGLLDSLARGAYEVDDLGRGRQTIPQLHIPHSLMLYKTSLSKYYSNLRKYSASFQKHSLFPNCTRHGSLKYSFLCLYGECSLKPFLLPASVERIFWESFLFAIHVLHNIEKNIKAEIEKFREAVERELK